MAQLKNNNHHVAIMAGGIGSRFWPKSRIAKPKQFLDITQTGKSLLQITYERFAKFIPEENIYIVTSKDYVALVNEHLPQVSKDNILGEPARKNTAPCIAYISFKLQQKKPQAQLICAPADHLILQEEEFEKTCLHALQFITKAENSFVTIGIKPTHPNTGFGYIQFVPQQDATIFKVKTFTEKPDLELAKNFVESGEFLWNGGIFIAYTHNLLSAFEKHLPDVYELFQKNETCFNTQLEANAIEKIYPQCPNLSFDYGIMEKVKDVFVLPASFDWNDLGTWNSLYEVNTKDEQQNVCLSQPMMTIDAKNNIISAEKEKLVVIKGLENFIVIDTPDALMIYPKNEEQEIKTLTEELKAKKMTKYL